MEKSLINSNIKFLINTKLSEFQRNNVVSINYADIEKTLMATKWKDGIPEHISMVAQDIHNLTLDEVIDTVSLEKI